MPFVRLIFLILKAAILLALPFIILIRGSIFLHLYIGLGPWMSLILSMVVVFAILMIYLKLIFRFVLKVKKVSVKMQKFRRVVVAGIILFYCGYTMVSFSKANAKTEKQHNEYTDLHPMLRIGLSTVLFLDMKLVVTDMARQKVDYRMMGLPVKERSMHYKQKDGYVHAVDLRTIGRGEFRNQLLQLYFDLMGFNTLRHDGTADHLHISIPPQDNLNAI